MQTDRIDTILAETLEDLRMSRSEQRALRAVLGERLAGAADRSIVRARAFELARREISERAGDPVAARAVLTWLEELVRLLEPRPDHEPRAEAHFSPGRSCLERIVSLFAEAQHSVEVCVFTITDDRITNAIGDAHRRGVRLRVITDDDKALDRGSDIEQLVRWGIEVRRDDSPHHMHHKFAIFDGRLVLTGSYNWTRSAERANQENLVVLEHPALIAAFSRTFEQLWRRFER
ncbi:MAG: DUF1669 domain-containing protein [Planctomycetota bacterium]|nr:MAG: DUF1669 domain-containing protein [Planctomycetota bacterium]